MADSTFLIDILRNDARAVSKASDLERKNVPIITTSISAFEILKGIRTTDHKKVEKVREFLQSLTVIAFDFDCSVLAADIYRDLTSQGTLIDPEDCMIAGIALQQKKSLLTRNRRHFERIEELTVESY